MVLELELCMFEVMMESKRALLALMYVNNGTNSYAGATSGESVMAIFSDPQSLQLIQQRLGKLKV